MSNTTIIHVMNSGFGQMDQFGGRSRKIVDSDKSGNKYIIFANPFSSTGNDHNIIEIIKINTFKKLIGYGLAVLKLQKIRRRLLWKDFDRQVAARIKKMDLTGVIILHSWEWIPETIKTVKKIKPDIKIIRDIVVNRYYEYHSGDPITDEVEYTDLFLSPSSFTSQCFDNWNIPSVKRREIPFGTDIEEFHPVDKKDDTIRYSFSGGLSRRKGTDSLLRVWNKLQLENAELHLYGRIRDIDKRLLKMDSIFTYGYIPLSEELPKNDVFVFPSLLEGSAKSVYEALACGLAVVTTPNSGSVVRDGIDGIIIEEKNDGILEEAILKLYRDRTLLNKMKASARERAGQFTWEIYARNILAMYDDVLKNSAE